MADFKFTSDDISKRGFISKESVLEEVTQEEIFGLVFKELPEEFEYVASPFREDKNPGCWFQYHIDNKLRFIDFGNKTTVSGISMKNIDCFDAVQIFYGFTNFYLTLEFIYKTLIQNKEVLTTSFIAKKHSLIKKESKKEVKILIEPKEYVLTDKYFWFNRYGITRPQLIEDKVYTFSRFHILNSKKGSFSSHYEDLSYAFTDFPQGKKKLYFPNKDKRDRFITTCTQDDIGGLSTLVATGRQLIITKSYKDWRVLKNLGKNVVWFQSETSIPEISLLIMLVKRFREVIVFFDNDAAGIQACEIVTTLINSHLPGKAKSLWLPEKYLLQKVSDPSDLYHIKGPKILKQFITQFT